MLEYNNISELRQYRPAQLVLGKHPRIEYYAYNPETNKLHRKQIRLKHISGSTERKRYAYELIKRLNDNLSKGWNPFINPEAKKSYTKLADTIEHFLKVARRKLEDDTIRHETYKDYVSYLKNLSDYAKSRGYTDLYLYKVDKTFISEFLDHIYIERGRTAQTRNNYLNVLRVFSNFLLEKDYVKVRPTDGVNVIKKSEKLRTVIEPDDLEKIRNYLEKNNKYYLLASYILYYTFIRPKEMSHLKISDFSLFHKTIKVSGEFAKNRKTQTVSLPDFIAKFMLDLKIFESDPEYYLFSDDFKPGKSRKSEKQFRDYWLKLREVLKFPESYKFYSFKDTGITELLEKHPTLIVRDQARHSSIAITDKYTRHNRIPARKEITDLENTW